VHALYFRVSSERQTTENQFEDLLCVAEKDGFLRDWVRSVMRSPAASTRSNFYLKWPQSDRLSRSARSRSGTSSAL
jgi:hypothetical protein